MNAPEATSPALILVADDVPANVELLFDQLRTLGYDTVAAHDGPSALAAAFAHHPDLCILAVNTFVQVGSSVIRRRTWGKLYKSVY